jgi:hypothetical protein
VELLIDRKRYAEAGSELDRFLSRYPNSVLRGRADTLKQRLEKESHGAVAGPGVGATPLSSGGQAARERE